MAKQVGNLTPYLPREILDRYEILNYRNAAQILSNSANAELSEIIKALRFPLLLQGGRQMRAVETRRKNNPRPMGMWKHP